MQGHVMSHGKWMSSWHIDESCHSWNSSICRSFIHVFRYQCKKEKNHEYVKWFHFSSAMRRRKIFFHILIFFLLCSLIPELNNPRHQRPGPWVRAQVCVYEVTNSSSATLRRRRPLHILVIYFPFSLEQSYLNKIIHVVNVLVHQFAHKCAGILFLRTARVHPSVRMSRNKYVTNCIIQNLCQVRICARTLAVCGYSPIPHYSCTSAYEVTNYNSHELYTHVR